MITKKPAEIWAWYLKIQDFHASGMRPMPYCEKHNISYRAFRNMMYRIEYKKHTHPEFYEKFLTIFKQFKESGMTIPKFAKENNIDPKVLRDFKWHLNHLEVIEKYKAKQEDNQMSFFEVPQLPPPIGLPLEPSWNSVIPIPMPLEPVEVGGKNDLEIIISKGVRVILSPNIDAISIIKIIELLKDL
jgi:hypothetical protein